MGARESADIMKEWRDNLPQVAAVYVRRKKRGERGNKPRRRGTILAGLSVERRRGWSDGLSSLWYSSEGRKKKTKKTGRSRIGRRGSKSP